MRIEMLVAGELAVAAIICHSGLRRCTQKAGHLSRMNTGALSYLPALRLPTSVAHSAPKIHVDGVRREKPREYE
jgi:hypothetical protein